MVARTCDACDANIPLGTDCQIFWVKVGGADFSLSIQITPDDPFDDELLKDLCRDCMVKGLKATDLA